MVDYLIYLALICFDVSHVFSYRIGTWTNAFGHR